MLQSETVRKYDTYKDSGIEWIGEIPQNWELLRLQFCLDEIKQKNNPIQSEQVLSLVKDRGVMLYEEKGNVGNVAKEDISEYKLAYPNTLILNSMNILIGSVGISNYFGCVSPVYYVFKETDKSDLRFINYIFTTREFQKELRRYANGIMEIRLRVSAQDIFKRKIAFPNKQEQIKIADYLDKKCGEIDRVIETEKLVIEKLKEYKQSIITEAVTKGLDKSVPLKDSGIEWIGQIPQNWKVLKFSNIAKVKSNLVNPNEYLSYYQISPENIEKDTGNLLNNFCTVEESGVISGNHLFFKGQILYSKIRPNLNKVTIAPFDGLCSADMYPIETDVNTNYFLYTMLSDTFVSQVKLYIENRVKMPKINQNELSNIYVAIPNDSKEQELIAEYLDKKCSEIDKAIANKEQVIEKFTEYKKSLIYECVTGKRKVV